MKMLVREDMPEWYRLSHDKEGVLSVIVSPEAIAELQPIRWAEAPIVRLLQETFGFKEFASIDQPRFGFEQVAEVESSEDVVIFRFDLRPIARPKGKESFCDWQYAFAVSASLNVLLSALTWSVEAETLSRCPQLLTVTGLTTKRDLNGGSLGADLSPALCHWLAGKSKIEHWLEVTLQMQVAYRRMTNRIQAYYRHHTFATIQPTARLCLNCEGNATCLYVEGSTRYEVGRGLELNSHNVDSPVQQLTLLVGLATICDLYRSEHLA